MLWQTNGQLQSEVYVGEYRDDNDTGREKETEREGGKLGIAVNGVWKSERDDSRGGNAEGEEAEEGG